MAQLLQIQQIDFVIMPPHLPERWFWHDNRAKMVDLFHMADLDQLSSTKKRQSFKTLVHISKPTVRFWQTKCRLLLFCRVHLFIKWTGTHAAYTDLCSKNNQYTVEEY